MRVDKIPEYINIIALIIFIAQIIKLLIFITEGISFYQSVMISDSMLGYLIIGIINCVSLFVIVNLLTNGALMEAFKAWLPIV